jgi:hypothetical protein
MVRCLDDGRIEIDNSAAERALRGVAIGRRNYLFAGSDRGGERAAVFYAPIGSAKLNGLDIETQLAALEQSLRAETTGPIREGSCGGLIAKDAFRPMVDVETLASQKPHERYVELLCNLNGKARRRTYAHYHRNSPHQGLLKQFEARPAR